MIKFEKTIKNNLSWDYRIFLVLFLEKQKRKPETQKDRVKEKIKRYNQK
jgi:hypothetical protein